MPPIYPSRSVRLSALLLATALSACTFVKPIPGAEAVRIIDPTEAEGCTQLGTIATESRDRVAGVARGSAKLQKELETLARNEAVRLEANAVAPASVIEDGRQQFRAYRCP